MAGFQIPGLGKAVPNEVLPPLSSFAPTTEPRDEPREELREEPRVKAGEEVSMTDGEQATNPSALQQQRQTTPSKASEELRQTIPSLAEGEQQDNQLQETRQDSDLFPAPTPEAIKTGERCQQDAEALPDSTQADKVENDGEPAGGATVTGEQAASDFARSMTLGEHKVERGQEDGRGQVPAESEQVEGTMAVAEQNSNQDYQHHHGDVLTGPAKAAANTTSGPREEPIETNHRDEALGDPMAVDPPESPPSLTNALLAAIGGLESASATAEDQQASNGAPQTGDGLQNDEGEHPEWEIDSAPYDSSDSSSSDSSDSDSDNEAYELLGIDETVRLLMETEAGSDDEGGKGGKGAARASARSKNELPDEVIPRPDVEVTADMKMEELGWVEHIVEGNIVVKAITPGEYQVLDTGSVLCTADRIVVGVVAETLGKVLQPMYTVRFNSEDEIRQLGIEVGTKVFYPVDLALYVFTEPLKALKGSDASNIHDEEVAADEMEFSDDEKEAEHKRAMKPRNKNKRKDGGRGAPHPLRQETTMAPDDGLNYDDDGPYRPLSRPPGYGGAAAAYEPVETSPRSQPQRGGRRNDRRGRGGRGRDSQGRDHHGGRRGSREGFSLPPQGFQQQSAPPPGHNGSWASLTPSAYPGPPPQAPAGPPSAPAFSWQPTSPWPMQPAAHQAHGASGPPPPPPPPPPPGWTSQPAVAVQGQQPGNGGTFVNPTLIAALMSQLQGQNGGQQQQQQWSGQQQPQWQPPPGGWSR
ncbi:hypothetical protein XA68_11068 [Ophiocordyceps unilateralis]|uniref:H/ACA ribonucleoprotein complex non-core subunit NAF1 n=1 Tax=Ophiocordyceps unilateralis TaxID=268505 RepID=A0A2A9PHR9_OPHUN|nr:hypothetical protein XA68_11068 [Ophiocordyceps unilateralis]